jgi:hypothetical protein
MSQNEFKKINKANPISDSGPSSDSYIDPLGELSNHEYFNVNKEYKLDFVIQKVKSKPRKNMGVNPTRIINSLTSFFNYSTKKELAIEPDKTVKKKVLQPGKMDINWSDITCTCAVGDSLIMGFGNGALICIDTRNNVPVNESIQFVDLSFTDSGDKSEDKQE